MNRLFFLLSAIIVLLCTNNNNNVTFAMTSSALPKLRFIYADHIFWRAECIRMALEFGNVPFADARLSRDEIKELKEEVSVTIT